MPENEFEKKVSSELQELRFKPSESVWMQVEERIRRKNKRRIFVILFLVVGIALLGYFQWDNFFGEKNGDIVKTEKPAEEKNNTGNDNDPGTKEDNKVNDQTQQIKSAERSTSDNKEFNTDKSTNKIDIPIPGNTVSRKTTTVSKKIVSPVEQKNRIQKTDKNSPKTGQKRVVVLTEEGLAIVTTDDTRKLSDSAKVKFTETDNVKQDLKQTIVPSIDKGDSIRLDTLVIKNDIKKDSTVKTADHMLNAVPADSLFVRLPPKPSFKKWNFGIEFIPGISSFKEDLFSFNMNKSADAYASPGTGSGVVVPDGPVKSNSGFAFQFGGFLKRQFIQKSSLIVGLRWAFYTEDMRIGARMYPVSSSPAFSQLLDALGVNSAFDAGGYSYYHTNKYHFIELPVNYSVQLNKRNAHPLTLNAGIKAGRMFASDALVYDTAAGGIYYSSKKHFNKTQFGISTSLNWKVTKKDKFHLAIGPVFDMHLNSMLDNPYDKDKYLLFIGIRTSVIFNSKK